MNFKRNLIAASMMVAGSTAAFAAPSNQELWQKMQEMQQQISNIKQQNQQLKAENSELKNKMMETEEAVEAVAEASERSVGSLLGGKNTTIGGYGELHYNNLEERESDEEGGETSSKDQIDFHRFVLFFGHEFTDNLRFFSELEIEHSLIDKNDKGAVELEQAYVEYDFMPQHRVKAGLFLIPVGILNETHEPDTFYGVERNSVEKNIVPTTWWEAGVMFSGELGNGFSYDAGIHSGLDVTKDGSKDTFKIRDGRQKVAKADANDWATTGRLRWTGIPGVTLGTTVQYQQDITQGFADESAEATLFEAHAVIKQGPFGLKALYAQWDVDGDGAKVDGYDEQEGWYISPSYRINDNFGVFVTYSEWDNQAGKSSIKSEWDSVKYGINWWLHKNVVIKADYVDNEKDDGEESKGMNLGVGYQF